MKVGVPHHPMLLPYCQKFLIGGMHGLCNGWKVLASMSRLENSQGVECRGWSIQGLPGARDRDV